MASDQRYCIECGERRTGGGLRDAIPRTQTTTVASAATTPPRRTGWLYSSSGTLIAGVATLLIALGVGVLIGRTGHNNAAPASARQPVQVVTVAGNGPATTPSAAATAATAGAAAKAATAHHHKSASAAKSKPVQGASSVQQTAAQNHVKLPPPVVKVGSKCAKGAKGCQGGKFTGKFFGG
jgi:predicted lipid-binding transport protein (Tim44 family)